MKKEIFGISPIIVSIFVKSFNIISSPLDERQQFYKATLDLISKPLIVTIDEKEYLKYRELKVEFSNFVFDTYGKCQLKYYPQENFTYVVKLTIEIETDYEKIKIVYSL